MHTRILTFRAGTSSAVRVERIETVAPYQSAFDYLTKFYNRKAARPKLNETESSEIDMTGDIDEMPGPSSPKSAPQRPEIREDPMELAAGLPGMFAPTCDGKS